MFSSSKEWFRSWFGSGQCAFTLVCDCRQSPLCSLQWHRNEHDSVSNNQPHDCLLNRLFGHNSTKTSNLRFTGLCAINSPGTGEFPAQRTSYAENVSIWWHHHVFVMEQIKENACVKSVAGTLLNCHLKTLKMDIFADWCILDKFVAKGYPSVLCMSPYHVYNLPLCKHSIPPMGSKQTLFPSVDIIMMARSMPWRHHDGILTSLALRCHDVIRMERVNIMTSLSGSVSCPCVILMEGFHVMTSIWWNVSMSWRHYKGNCWQYFPSEEMEFSTNIWIPFHVYAYACTYIFVH